MERKAPCFTALHVEHRLPLEGKVSPKATDEVVSRRAEKAAVSSNFHPQMSHNVFTYTIEITVYIGIGIPQNGQALLSQETVAFLVIGLTRLLEMLTTVQFDHKFYRGNIEINNIGSDRLLSVCMDSDSFEKVVPEVSLFFRHFPPQPLGVSFAGGVIQVVHG